MIVIQSPQNATEIEGEEMDGIEEVGSKLCMNSPPRIVRSCDDGLPGEKMVDVMCYGGYYVNRPGRSVY